MSDSGHKGSDHHEGIEVVDSIQTTCCVVGAGPGGTILSLLLARQGIPVIVLEAHDDFDRDFRGDTIHPSVLHLMDELGLAEQLLQLRHSKLHTAMISTPDGPIAFANFRRVEKKVPFHHDGSPGALSGVHHFASLMENLEGAFKQ